MTAPGEDGSLGNRRGQLSLWLWTPQAEADLPEAGPSVFDRLARRRPVERPTTMFGTQSGGTLILPA